MPFGVGPKPASPGYADHAHQQFLEALAIGGWLGLAGCLAFVVMAMWIAVRVAGLDNRATIGVLFVMGAIFQVDVFTYSANYTNLNNAYILIVAIVVSAAGILKPDAGAVGVAGTLRPAEPAAAAG
jgi:O-antigen ligase